mgnify:CR=1 FL=1
MREIILISFLGPDQPNQFTRLMQVLSVHSLQILDVGQAVIHNQLTLGIVVSSDDQTATALAMKEILILAHDIGLTVRFKPISAAEYDQWVSEGGPHALYRDGFSPGIGCFALTGRYKNCLRPGLQY